MFDAYKVAVKLTLVNQVSSGLSVIIKHLKQVHDGASSAQGSLSLVEKRLKEIKLAGAVGGMVAGAGFAGLALMRGPLEEARKFDRQVGKFRLFGLGDAVTKEAATYAKAMNVMGSTAVENMRLMNEAQGVFRESGLTGSKALEGAKLAAPMLAKINFATSSLDEESQSKMRTASMAMLRYVEMSGGLKGPDEFNKIANEGWKAIQSSGGNINWEQLRQARAKGGTALMSTSARALYGEDEPLIGELKGGAYGDGLMTAYNRLTGVVKLPNQIAHLLTKNGLWDEKQIEWNSQGGIKSFKGNPFKDLDMFSTSRLDFYEKKILPMYKTMGLSENEIIRENAMIFGRTGGRLFNLVHRQRETMHKSADAWEKALGVDASVGVASKTLSGKEADLHAKWKNALLQLGEVVLPLAIKGVEKLTSALTDFIKFTKDHPTIVKSLTVAFVGLSAAMAFGGTVLMLSAGIRGLGLAVGIMNAAGGAGGLLGLGGRLLGVSGGIGGLGGAAAALLNPVGLAVLALGTLAGAIYAFRPQTQAEVDAAKTDGGAKLTPSAAARLKAMGWEAPSAANNWGKHGKEWYQFGPKVIDMEAAAHARADRERALAAAKAVSPKVGSAAPAPSRNSFVPPPPALQPVFKVENKFDYHGLTTKVTQMQAKEMRRPHGGSSTFDGSMNTAPVGLAFAGS